MRHEEDLSRTTVPAGHEADRDGPPPSKPGQLSASATIATTTRDGENLVSARSFQWIATAATALLLATAIPHATLSGRPQTAATVLTLAINYGFALVVSVAAVVRAPPGVERRWRVLLTCGQLAALPWTLVWIYHYFTEGGTYVSPPATGAFGLLGLLFFLLGLLSVPTQPIIRDPPAHGPPHNDIPRRVSAIVIALDSLMIVFSMLLIAWVTVLRNVAGLKVGGVPFLVAMAYVIAATVVAVAILLLLTFRRPRNRRAMALLAVGMLLLVTSDSALVYHSLSGPISIASARLEWAGVAAEPVLLALAMIVPQPRARFVRHRHDRAVLGRVPPGDIPSGWLGSASLWAHAFLPYLPLSVAALLVGVSTLRGEELGHVAVRLSMVIALLVIVRQIISVWLTTRLFQTIQAAHHRLRHQALHDDLTGLANRVCFEAELDAAIGAHREREQPLVLLYCDLDQFKEVNDNLGHSAGDELLRAVAGRLRSSVRTDDLVARLGGDEFAVLMADPVGDPHAAGDRTAQRVHAAMQPPFSIHGQLRFMHISIGLALADIAVPVRTAEELLHRADMAMYEAKRSAGQRHPRGPRGSRRRSGRRQRSAGRHWPTSLPPRHRKGDRETQSRALRHRDQPGGSGRTPRGDRGEGPSRSAGGHPGRW
jgi:diguanylate cyclase (GGDEF)-like protein